MLKRANGRRRTRELNREGLLTEFQWTHASHYCTSVCLAGRHLCVCVCVSVPQQLAGAVEPTFNMLDCPAEQGRLSSSVTSPPDFKNKKIHQKQQRDCKPLGTSGQFRIVFSALARPSRRQQAQATVCNI